ncbi:unnamed protein product, partial [Hymenolepis diminuta]|uniref:Cadherin domain-containing protein n=1 Tax=Hymenolepis diminuta TaxID=6216 RepID=A0A0R3SKS6_HYMDI
PIHRGEPLVQLHATDYDIYENGELRFGFAEETDDTVANLFAIHPQSGLMVSKYSLQLKDLEYLAPSNSILKQAYIVKIKVTDMGTPPLISYASLRIRFQMRVDEIIDKSFPSLQEQLLLEQHQLQNNEAYPSDLFTEYTSGRAESTQSSDSTVWRSGMIFIILCVFFLVLLLILATLLLAIFTRRTLRPSTLNTHCPAGIPIVTTTSAPITFRHAPSALLVSPLHHHQNHNYQRSGSSPTLPTAVPTPCHTLPLNYHLRHSEICASGGDLSLDSSAV